MKMAIKLLAILYRLFPKLKPRKRAYATLNMTGQIEYINDGNPRYVWIPANQDNTLFFKENTLIDSLNKGD